MSKKERIAELERRVADLESEVGDLKRQLDAKPAIVWIEQPTYRTTPYYVPPFYGTCWSGEAR